MVRWNISLSFYGYSAGVIGLLWRPIAVIITTISAQEATLILMTTYLLLTIPANVFFIVGIKQKWYNVLFPYLIIQGTELCGGSVVLYYMLAAFLVQGFPSLFYMLLIPVSFSISALQGMLFFQSYRLFKHMLKEHTLEEFRIRNLRQPPTRY